MSGPIVKFPFGSVYNSPKEALPRNFVSLGVVSPKVDKVDVAAIYGTVSINGYVVGSAITNDLVDSKLFPTPWKRWALSFQLDEARIQKPTQVVLSVGAYPDKQAKERPLGQVAATVLYLRPPIRTVDTAIDWPDLTFDSSNRYPIAGEELEYFLCFGSAVETATDVTVKLDGSLAVDHGPPDSTHIWWACFNPGLDPGDVGDCDLVLVDTMSNSDTRKVNIA